MQAISKQVPVRFNRRYKASFLGWRVQSFIAKCTALYIKSILLPFNSSTVNILSAKALTQKIAPHIPVADNDLTHAPNSHTTYKELNSQHLKSAKFATAITAKALWTPAA